MSTQATVEMLGARRGPHTGNYSGLYKPDSTLGRQTYDERPDMLPALPWTVSIFSKPTTQPVWKLWPVNQGQLFAEISFCPRSCVAYKGHVFNDQKQGRPQGNTCKARHQ